MKCLSNSGRICALLHVTLLCLYPTSVFPAASFNEVYAVVFGAPPAPQTTAEAEEQAVYQQGELPHYTVGMAQFLVDGINILRKDAIRTVNDDSDYLARLEKRVHANGICFAGTWIITEDSPYSGYFRQDAEGLIIARASATLSETKRGQPRGLSLAGKLFPTLDPDLAVNTANFFLVDVLMGAQRDHYLDVSMTNQPATGFRWPALLPAAFTLASLLAADRNPLFRPLYPIAEMDLANTEDAKVPRFMMVRGHASNPRNEQVDFRDELSLSLNGNDALRFEIRVNNSSANHRSRHWVTIGEMVLTESIVSYGCDRQLHFAHPKLR